MTEQYLQILTPSRVVSTVQSFELCISLLGMGRHRHKKVSDKDAEENITKQLVESGKKEELKNMVQRNS